jgi:hypothetical protein
MTQLQQGDVLLEKIGAIPHRKEAKLKRHVRGWVLAEGEATGHAHEVIGDGVEVYEHDGVLYLSAPNGGTVKHEEHKTITVPPGNYRVGIVQEYDHFAEEARQVRD